MKVAINGFGRIGRSILRASLNHKNINIVAINDLGDVNTLAHLLKYDSVFGVLPYKVKVTNNLIRVGGKSIIIVKQSDPKNLPWKKLGIDVVVESTGLFTTKQLASQHLKAGAKRVIISAPYEGGDYVKTIILGVNEKKFDSSQDFVISNGSCTTNCLAPMAKVLHDNFGIEKGFMTTVHAYTSSQRLVDAPESDLRRARAAAVNIVLTTSGATSAVTEAIPELKGKIDGISLRVPVINGSITDFVSLLKKEVTINKINNAFKKASKTNMKGILEYSEEPLVSTDIIGNPHSSIIDSLSTQVVQGNLVKTVSWYDNEWGYSNRVLDLIKYISK